MLRLRSQVISFIDTVPIDSLVEGMFLPHDQWSYVPCRPSVRSLSIFLNCYTILFWKILYPTLFVTKYILSNSHLFLLHLFPTTKMETKISTFKPTNYLIRNKMKVGSFRKLKQLAQNFLFRRGSLTWLCNIREKLFRCDSISRFGVWE